MGEMKFFKIKLVIFEIYCFFFGHKISDQRICTRCKSEFGIPKMKNPPNPPIPFS